MQPNKARDAFDLSIKKLLEQVHESIDRAEADFLPEFELTENAVRARAKLDNSQQQKSVLIIGEINRGKSSLANALVGEADAIPCGVDFTTTTVTALQQATSGADSQTAILYDSQGQWPVPISELRNLISREKQSTFYDDNKRIPTRVTVPIQSSKMNDVIVIDTPGIGGINPELASAATLSAENACLIVIAVDSSTPITKPEMDFIQTVAQNTDGIIVAATKIDKNLTRWRQIVEEDERLLKLHTGRAIPVYGVSSLLAVKSGNHSSEDVDGYESISGIHELREEINKRISNTKLLGAANALRTILSSYRLCINSIGEAESLFSTSGPSIESLKEKENTITLLQEKKTFISPNLNRDISNLAIESNARTEQLIKEAKNKWLKFVSLKKMRVLREDPQYFTAQFEQDFSKIPIDTAAQFIDKLKIEVYDQYFPDGQLWDELLEKLIYPSEYKEISTPFTQRKMSYIDPMTVVSFSSGGGLATALAGAAGTTVGAPVIIAAGTGLLALTAGYRILRTSRSNLEKWLIEIGNETRSKCNQIIGHLTNEAKPMLDRLLKQQIDKEIEDARNQLSLAAESFKSSQIERTSKLSTLGKKKESLNAEIRRVEFLLQRVYKQLEFSLMQGAKTTQTSGY